MSSTTDQTTIEDMLLNLGSDMRRRYVLGLLKGCNQTEAAINAGYSPDTAHVKGSQLRKVKEIADILEKFYLENAATAAEIISRNSDVMRFNIGQYLNDDGSIDFKGLKNSGDSYMIKSVKRTESYNKKGDFEVTVDLQLQDAQRAREFGAKILGLDKSDNASETNVTVKIIGGFDPDKV